MTPLTDEQRAMLNEWADQRFVNPRTDVTPDEAVARLQQHSDSMLASERGSVKVAVALIAHDDAILHLLVVVLDQQRRIEALEAKLKE